MTVTVILFNLIVILSDILLINMFTRNMFPPNIVAATMHQTKLELIYPGENNVSRL